MAIVKYRDGSQDVIPDEAFSDATGIHWFEGEGEDQVRCTIPWDAVQLFVQPWAPSTPFVLSP
ncbi:MAG: hypothetical protein QOI81_864 [Actinomycetota bacterium]|jgi:hypothetical protein|nr:hypothetical protein [Actinomycetota bacterium]MEA2551661.1 hypothetical protein [Actinomycetota bacterium]